MPKKLDITGEKYNKLTALREAGRNTSGKIQWECECECGNIIVAVASHLRSGNTKSCGCLQREKARKRFLSHGDAKTPFYKVWNNIMSRCHNENSVNYAYYGGRGIAVCERWHTYENFKEDMLESYLKHKEENHNTSLERIDVDKGYSPCNCKWVTMTEQGSNRRRNKMITFNGVTKTLAEWSHETGLDWTTIRSRIERYDWSIEKALTTKPKKTGRKPKTTN